MKIQEIRRNGGKYYHIYLPKNIIENVLHWKAKDNLSYHVSHDTLSLKRELESSNGWQDYLQCKVCFNPAIPIKIIKNTLQDQYQIVARCPLDQTIIKTSLPADHYNDWKHLILHQIFSCDICNGTLLEEKRKFSRLSTGFQVHLKLFCRDCRRHRIKVLPQNLWEELHIPDSSSPVSSASTFDPGTPRCPTCEEPISIDQSFCSQCGALLQSLKPIRDIPL